MGGNPFFTLIRGERHDQPEHRHECYVWPREGCVLLQEQGWSVSVVLIAYQHSAYKACVKPPDMADHLQGKRWLMLCSPCACWGFSDAVYTALPIRFASVLKRPMDNTL